MSTRASEQQKKQRQKEFKERKENQERLKADQKTNRATGKSNADPDEVIETNT